MSVITTKFALQDAMTPALRLITRSLHEMNGNVRAAQRAIGPAFDPSNCDEFRGELEKISDRLEELEKGYNDLIAKQEQYNQKIRAGSDASSGLAQKLKGTVAAYAAAQGVQKLVELSDTMASGTARLGMVGESYGETDTDAIKSGIFAAAQRSRGGYGDLMSSVAKLGLAAGAAFSGTDEIVRFSELVNKNLVVGGASSTEQASAVYQLTQAMSSGRLQGDEYRSIIENAPLLAKSIEDYMRNIEGAQGTMKDWASEGLLTAEVIKAAVFANADEVESRFASMPYTWSQVMTTMSNHAIIAFEPLLDTIGDLANNTDIQNTIQGTVQIVATVAADATKVLAVLSKNWGVVRTAVIAVTAALIAYKIAQMASNVQSAIAAAREAGLVGTKGAMIGITAGLTGATVQETAAQWALNTAMFACPAFWIAGAIGAVAGIAISAASNVSAAADSVSDLSDEIKDYKKEYTSAMSQIKLSDQASYVDAEKVKSIYERIGDTLNTLAGGGYASADEVNTVYASVQALYEIMPSLESTVASQVKDWEDLRDVLKEATEQFYDLALANAYYNTYSKKLEEAVSQKIDLESTLRELPSKYLSSENNPIMTFAAGTDEAKLAQRGYTVVDAETVARDAFGLTSSSDIADFVNQGYVYAYANLHNQEYRAESYSIRSAITAANEDIENCLSEMTEWREKAMEFNSTYQSDLGDIVENTSKSADELKYLRDIAEQEAVNRFTTAEVRIDMTGMTNKIESDADFDGFIGLLSDGLSEALATAAERAGT